MPYMKLTSPALPDGATKFDSFFEAKRYSIPLVWSQVPGAASYALLEVDLSVTPPKIYWMITYIPSSTLCLPENVKNRPLEASMIQQKNDFNVYGYSPFAALRHTYYFNIYALNNQLTNVTIGDTNKLQDFLSAIEPYVIDSAFLKCIA